MRLYTGDSRHDNSRTARRFRCAQPPEMPTGMFQVVIGSGYRTIIPNSEYQFLVKPYTPGGYWRVFFIDPVDGSHIEQARRISFAEPGQAIWQRLAEISYELTRLDNDEPEASSPPPSATCPDNQEIPW